jgi:hypothetical protein
MGIKRLKRRAERVATRQAKEFRKEDMGQKFNQNKLDRLSLKSDKLQKKNRYKRRCALL